MIVSESFIQSNKARDVEFTTNNGTSEKVLFVGHMINDMTLPMMPGSLSYYPKPQETFSFKSYELCMLMQVTVP